MAALRERRDRAIARKLSIQNRAMRGELIFRDGLKRVLGTVVGAWRSVVQEHSYSTAPTILAVLEEKDPAADARLRLLLDTEAYASGGNINRGMQKWLCLQEAREEGAGGK
jgi:hypothetical protein